MRDSSFFMKESLKMIKNMDRGSLFGPVEMYTEEITRMMKGKVTGK